MNLANHKQKKISGAMLLIMLAWLVYTSSYLGKVNYSANITEIIDFYGITKAQAGSVPTFFFFAYGTGQVINGLFCKRYNIKWVVFASLIISGTINLAVALVTDFSLIKWLWMINGFVLSMLWPSLIRMLSETLPTNLLGASSVIMGTTIALGTLIIYGLSSVFSALGIFKFAFFTAAAAVITVAVIWITCYNKAVFAAKSEKTADDASEQSVTSHSEKSGQQSGQRQLFATVCALCVLAVGVNLIKDGLTTWVPSVFKETFAISDSLSIFLTLFLPVLAVFGNAFSLKIQKRIPDYINHSVLLFTVIGGFILVVIGGLRFELMAVMFVGLLVSSFLASSLNSLITIIFPLFMREKLNSGKIAGILDGCCYLGSAASAWGLGVIADNFGWIYVFYTLLGVCAAAYAVWGVYICIKRAESQ